MTIYSLCTPFPIWNQSVVPCPVLWLALIHNLNFLKVKFILNYMQLRRRKWHPTAVLLPGKSHGWRSLVGCSPWGREESDTTERLHVHFSFSCIGEGNGNPLQCSCLENPRDGGGWWAAIYGVAQSRTRLKRLSSSIGLPWWLSDKGSTCQYGRHGLDP